MAPQASAKAAARRARQARAKAAAAFQESAYASSRNHIELAIAEDPTLLRDLESFVRSKLNAPETAPENKVARFCRGRTLIEKIPPTFQFKLIVETLNPIGKLRIADLVCINKHAQQFLPRLQSFLYNLDPKANIAKTMDRREKVYAALAADRHTQLGERIKIVDEKWASLAASFGPKDKTIEGFQWPFDVLGLFSRIGKDGQILQPGAADGEQVKILKFNATGDEDGP